MHRGARLGSIGYIFQSHLMEFAQIEIIFAQVNLKGLMCVD